MYFDMTWWYGDLVEEKDYSLSFILTQTTQLELEATLMEKRRLVEQQTKPNHITKLKITHMTAFIDHIRFTMHPRNFILFIQIKTKNWHQLWMLPPHKNSSAHRLFSKMRGYYTPSIQQIQQRSTSRTKKKRKKDHHQPRPAKQKSCC